MSRVVRVRKYRRRVKGKGIKVRDHNRSLRRGKVVVGKKGIRLSGPVREVFDRIATNKADREYGGFMDFNLKGDLERFSVHPGTRSSVDIDFDDYESGFHTHPSTPLAIGVFPSVDDLLSDDASPVVEFIFGKGRVLVFKRTEAGMSWLNSLSDVKGYFNRFYNDRKAFVLDKLRRQAVFDRKLRVDDSYFNSRFAEEMDREIVSELRRRGFDVFLKFKGGFSLPVKPREVMKKDRKR